MAKGKEKMYKDTIMQDNDAIVADLSDVEVDLGFLGSPGDAFMYDALDPGAESDGANSWHSEEMKTPPNSEDKLESDGESDEFSIFQEGQRFGELQLQVGMKFNTKQDFRDAVAVCQVEECSWVVYASRDHEDSCWQIKTFYDDHACPRENSNTAANRAWLASKLVKKVRKYPNFKQCIPCVHACAALARVNKRPEDFCHPLVTMDSYRKTYEHYINPLPGQSMWEKSAYSKPQAPNIKRKPGKLTTKRRKDADEGPSAKANPTGSTPAPKASNTTNPATPAVDIPPPVSGPQAEEVELSQPSYGGTQDEAPPPPTTRPPKLPTKRKTSQQPVTTTVDPMQGASAATSSRLARFMKMVPTPQFKALRKKNP
ncbi:hypothetical protein Ahy_B07g086791 [Arachis hypogaea]|uniref:Transposase MuDR plant domain-containing protein n=1 Tax=Arachis hypogaea TaxID=3818 RepID=A0A444YAH0_ARAHY|nr:hypothetical protein Ahy_B07g086791 [Arachis hypogaea]